MYILFNCKLANLFHSFSIIILIIIVLDYLLLHMLILSMKLHQYLQYFTLLNVLHLWITHKYLY